MKKAIITGVNGQDGAYLSRLLVSRGYRVTGIPRSTNPETLTNLFYLDVYDSINIKTVDLMDLAAVIRLFEEEKPDEFYNLAAQSSVGKSFRYPVETFQFNTLSVLNILEAIRITGMSVKFYQASSSEMFGNIALTHLPLHETILFHPVSPYGISKASAHWTAVNYRETYKVFSACGVLFNHESCLRGKDYVTKKIIRTAIGISRGEATELVVGNIDVQRDWGYAPAYVEAMWLILQQQEASDYLICSGTCTSLRTFIEKVFAQLDLDYKKYIKTDPSLLRSNDLPVIYGSNAKAQEILNWNYKMDIDQLITKLIADERDFMYWEKTQKKSSGQISPA